MKLETLKKLIKREFQRNTPIDYLEQEVLDLIDIYEDELKNNSKIKSNGFGEIESPNFDSDTSNNHKKHLKYIVKGIEPPIKDYLKEFHNRKFLEDWLSLEEVSSFLNLKKTAIYDLLKNPKLKVSKIGQKRFIQKQSFENLLSENSNIKG